MIISYDIINFLPLCTRVIWINFKSLQLWFPFKKEIIPNTKKFSYSFFDHWFPCWTSITAYLSTCADFCASPPCVFTTPFKNLEGSGFWENKVRFWSLIARENHLAHASMLSGLWAPSKKKKSSFDISLLMCSSRTIWALPCRLAVAKPFMNCSGKVCCFKQAVTSTQQHDNNNT